MSEFRWYRIYYLRHGYEFFLAIYAANEQHARELAPSVYASPTSTIPILRVELYPTI